MNGEEFLNRISPSSSPLAQLFKRLVSIHGLKQEPVVVGTYNDLVLCCASMCSQRDYYICNPHTIQRVPLPPPPQVYKYVAAVGFTCDLPYLNSGGDDQQEDIIQLNAEYKYRVVRLIDFGNDDNHDNYETVSCEFNVQVFFSETGERREFILSSPSAFPAARLGQCIGVASNRMLYWLSHGGDFIFGLDPSMIDSNDNTGSSTTRSGVFFSEGDEWECVPVECLVTHDGCLRLCEYKDNLSVRLNKRVYLADEETVVIRRETDKSCGVVFDLNNEDILYMFINNLRALTKTLSSAIFVQERCQRWLHIRESIVFATSHLCSHGGRRQSLSYHNMASPAQTAQLDDNFVVGTMEGSIYFCVCL